MPGHAPKPLFTVMCEDTREEAFGKLSLLGIYSESIYFKERPMLLRLLSFYTRFSGGDGTFALSVRLEGPKGELIKKMKIGDPKFPGASDSDFTSVALGFSQLNLPDEGQYRFEIYLDDEPHPILHYPFGVHLRPDAFERKK